MSVGSGGETAVKKLKTQLWDSVVNIVLVEAKNVTDENTSSDIHCRFKLGSDKYKSKVCFKYYIYIFNCEMRYKMN